MIKLINNSGYQWENNNIVFVKGYAYTSTNKLLKGKQLISYFNTVSNKENFVEKLCELNGAFSIVIKQKNIVYAAVDHVRSFPIFYEKQFDKFLITDTIEKKFNLEYDKDSILELLSTTYSSGNSTLLKNAKQLLAGQYLIVKNDKIDLNFYYRHHHSYSNNYDNATHLNNLYNISSKVFNRVKKIALNNTIILPLSGGYDSRYIAAFLKKLHIEDVICYTYGKKGSFEVETSKKVAKQLGYKWYFIEYTKEKWNNILSLDELKKFNIYSFCYSSTPIYQEFIAINELKKRNILPENAIFIPGFSGDMLGGSLLPNNYFYKNEESLLKINLNEYIYDKYFSNETININKNKKQILKRITASLINTDIKTPDDFVNYFEEWFLIHRIGKYINNAVRIYEHFGYKWLLPLWDRELFEYWYTVPNKDRIESELYNSFLFEKLFKPLNIDYKKQDLMKPSRIRTNIKKIVPKSLIAQFRKLNLILKGKSNLIDINSYNAFATSITKQFDNKNIKINKSTHINRLYSLYVLHFDLDINIKKYLK